MKDGTEGEGKKGKEKKTKKDRWVEDEDWRGKRKGKGEKTRG